jgi:salicylate hydroxylase
MYKNPMETDGTTKKYWAICQLCSGKGKIVRGPSRRRRKIYQQELDDFTNKKIPTEPKPLTSNTDVCFNCSGSGLVVSATKVPVNNNYPNIAIIGGGIGGTALAVACLHRGIPFTLYERDQNFDARSQGYGLTLQQASNAIAGLGIFSLEDGITSTRHVVYNSEGKMIGEWGLRKWKKDQKESVARRKNVHISRQSLRSLLYQELNDATSSIAWGHSLDGFSKNSDETISIDFQVNGECKKVQADLIVGADGIRSSVRKQVIGEDITPMRYLGCIVILGICRLDTLTQVESDLLDSATVFQMVNGKERIYVMPYDQNSIMWQLSFSLSEEEARELNIAGAQAMKDEALRRLGQWHSPIPEIISASDISLITGYPVYDRTPFDPELLKNAGNVTLLGDAAHPMSPFKGQGANQALLDALNLARGIQKVCDENSNWREVGLRNLLLGEFEHTMAQRTVSKVEGSALAVELLHSDAVLVSGDGPRGRGIKKQ